MVKRIFIILLSINLFFAFSGIKKSKAATLALDPANGARAFFDFVVTAGALTTTIAAKAKYDVDALNDIRPIIYSLADKAYDKLSQNAVNQVVQQYNAYIAGQTNHFDVKSFLNEYKDSLSTIYDFIFSNATDSLVDNDFSTDDYEISIDNSVTRIFFYSNNLVGHIYLPDDGFIDLYGFSDTHRSMATIGYSVSNYCHIWVSVTYFTDPFNDTSNVTKDYTLYNYIDKYAQPDLFSECNSKAQDIRNIAGNINSLEGISHIFNYMGFDFYFNSYGQTALDLDLSDNEESGINKSKYSQVYIPTQDIVAKSPAGDVVSWDAGAGVYVDSLGHTFSPDEVKIDVPFPYVTGDGLVVDQPGSSTTVFENSGTVPGEGEGTGEGAGENTWSEEIAKNTAKTAENTTSILELLTTGLVGNPDEIDWPKLKTTFGAFKTKFPFSLPWDVKNAFDATFGQVSNTTIPHFHYEMHLNFLKSTKTVALDFDIPNEIQRWFPFVRSFILIIFDVSVIYAIRKWFGGAS